MVVDVVMVQAVITDDVVAHNGGVSDMVTVKSGVGMGLPMVGLLISIVEVGMTVLVEAAAICASVEVTSYFGSGPVAVASFAQ